jgi:hypothetical protein
MKCDKVVSPAQITVFKRPDSHGGRSFVICAKCLNEADYVDNKNGHDRFFCSNCRSWQVSVKEEP